MRILNGHNILNILYNTDKRTIASCIGTNCTNLRIADVMADLTIFNISSCLGYGCNKRIYPIKICFQ